MREGRTLSCRRLEGKMDVMAPGRRLLKEGALLKMSRKGPVQRYLVLFSDSFLYCKPKLPTTSADSGPLAINLVLSLHDDLTVLHHQHAHQEVTRLPLSPYSLTSPLLLLQEYRSHFIIQTTARSLIFCAKLEPYSLPASELSNLSFVIRSVVEKQEWISAFSRALSEQNNPNRVSTIRRPRVTLTASKATGLEARLCLKAKSNVGLETAPVMVPDSEVTMCQVRQQSLFVSKEERL